MGLMMTSILPSLNRSPKAAPRAAITTASPLPFTAGTYSNFRPVPGAHEKDRVEDWLHDQVCAGRMTLQEAQEKIKGNWLEIYKTLPPDKD